MHQMNLVLILCYSDMLCDVSRSEPPLVDEDYHHSALEAAITVIHTEFKPIFKTLNAFAKGDLIITLYMALGHHSWHDIQSFDSVNSACAYFYRELNYLIKVYVHKGGLKNTNTPNGLQRI